MNVVRLQQKPKLRLVEPQTTERVFGSPAFIARDRNPAIPQARFPIERKPRVSDDDIWI